MPGWSSFAALTEAQQAAMLGPLLLELAGQETPGTAGDEARLKRWWRDGAGIHWGTGGDYMQCVALATTVFAKHGVDIDPKAWCAALHKEFTGATPGHAPGETHETAQETTMGMQVTETAEITEYASVGKTGRMQVTVITPGQGSSGYYPPNVLEQAVKDRLIRRGTPVHFDHATESERHERPGRSVRDIAGVFTGDAEWADGRMVGEVQIFKAHREHIAEMAPFIGLSINGSATDIAPGMVEGKTVQMVEGLHSIDAVDLVERAGRGGSIDYVGESGPGALVDAVMDQFGLALVEAGFEVRERSFTADELNSLGPKGQAFKNGAGAWSYPTPTLADLDNAIRAWGRSAEGDRAGLKAYLKRRASALSAPSSFSDRINDLSESAADPSTTPDVPATRPDGKHNTESQETNMGQKTIEESEYTRLVEDAGRVKTLESERDTAVTERDTAVARAEKAEGQIAEGTRAATITRILSEATAAAGIALDKFQTAGIASEAVIVDDKVDETKTREAFDTALAELKPKGPRGLGGPVRTPVGEVEDVSDDDFADLDEAVFGGSQSGTIPTLVKEA